MIDRASRMFKSVVTFAKGNSNSAKNAMGIRKENPGKFDATVHASVREDYTDFDVIAKDNQASNNLIRESIKESTRAIKS